MTFELAFKASNTTVVHSTQVSILLPIHTILLALEHVFVRLIAWQLLSPSQD